MRNCPGCGTGMERRAFARKPHGTLDLDICWACHAIWFDRFESTALTPGAVLELFEAIDAHRQAPVRGDEARARCPVCRERLKETSDLQGTNRITYRRCERGHGRFTTFYQFLREKQFVRSLSKWEVDRLRAHVQQVRCSSCGGPVDLQREMQCAYCKAPLSILDADAMKKTLVELGTAEKRRHEVDPNAYVDALIAAENARKRIERAEAGRDARYREAFLGLGKRRTGLDLVEEALHAFLGK